ncbi:MAG: RNA polymerase sigma factor [Saprospiraceae bacterium]
MNLSIFHQQISPIRSKLYRFALRITGSVHEAEDVVQDVFEKVWKVTDEHAETVQNWEAWCMTLTRNRSIDKTRSRSFRRAAPLETTFDHASPAASPAQTAELGDTVAHVRKLMQELPEKQRLVMHLRDIEEMSYDEIAQTLDITLDQVKVNLHRARKAVRGWLLGLDEA